MEKYRLFDPNPKKPEPLPPAGTCDSQFHVFGPVDKYPIRPGAVYCTPEATIDAALKMHRTLGIERGVLVQSTAYGTDFRILYDALAKAGRNYQACVVIDDSVSDAELQRLHDAGVRGARFNFWKVLKLVPTPEEFKRSIARIEALGWYAKLHMPADELMDMMELFEPLKLDVVLDHFGRPEFEQGAGGPQVRFIKDLLKRGNWWMMLSNGDRWSTQGKPWDDAVAIARAYIEAAPDRMIWGSDWPHPLVTEDMPMKNDGELMELCYRYAGSEEMKRKIFVDNPARLFGFAT